MDTILTQNPRSKNPYVEARRRLKESITEWLKDGWTLEPLIISTNKDGSKKCIFLTEDGRSGSPRISIKSVNDLPGTANAILGRSQKYVVIDFDKIEYIKKVKLPKPCLIVTTGKGEHWYFHVGDIKQSYKLIFGECQYEKMGVYMPGSYHAPTGKFYEIKERFYVKHKLNFSHIKPYIKTGAQATEGRFHTQQKDTYKAMQSGNPDGVFEAYYEARKAGQTVTEAMSVAKPSLEKMEFIPDPKPPEEVATQPKKRLEQVANPFKTMDFDPSLGKDKQKSKTKTPDNVVHIITDNKEQKKHKWLLPDFIPFSAVSIWAGMTGQGRTTTLLNLLTFNAIGKKLPGTDQKGDKRPFLYHGPENAMDTIKKRVKDAGGRLKKDIHYFRLTHKGEKLPPMQITKGLLFGEIIKAILSNTFSAVVCDTLYLLLENQNKGAGQVLLPIALACQKSETAFIGVCHLKKQIADQEVIHHIRGDSDIVTIARSVVYMREGKEKDHRVIVPLKNSFTGNTDTGFVTSMADNNSPIYFKHYTDDKFKILKDHGKPFNSFTDAPRDSESEKLIKEIVTVYNSMGDGVWKSENFKTWLTKKTTKHWDKKAIQRVLDRAGLVRRQKGTFYAIFKK